MITVGCCPFHNSVIFLIMPTSQLTLAAVAAIARDLTSSLASKDRYDRLLTVVRRLIPCDAACLLRLDGEVLVPLASHGLSAQAAQRVYPRHQHPRLDLILRASEPLRFPVDSGLPDPFDHGLAAYPDAVPGIHACLGCLLLDDGEVVGALTADAVLSGAFDELDQQLLSTLGALAGAAMRSAEMMEQLEQLAEHRGQVVRALQRGQRRQGGFIGRSSGAQRTMQAVATVAPSTLPVLITGETGTGKELIARAVHDISPRHGETYLTLNCAALPDSMVESELFGHTAGAFTGSTGSRAGAFEIADQGTLFLDEIGELPLAAQAALLRVLQNGEIQRLGADRPLKVDVRVVAATNRDLQAEVHGGRFRADLYHRLAAFPIAIPPLRERREDIPLLSRHLLDEVRQQLGSPPLHLPDATLSALQQAAWPGNVRELHNVLQRAVLLASQQQLLQNPLEILPEHCLQPTTTTSESFSAASPEAGSTRNLRQRLDDFQRREIQRLLNQHNQQWASVARELGLHRSNLHRLAQRLGLRGTD